MKTYTEELGEVHGVSCITETEKSPEGPDDIQHSTVRIKETHKSLRETDREKVTVLERPEETQQNFWVLDETHQNIKEYR